MNSANGECQLPSACAGESPILGQPASNLAMLEQQNAESPHVVGQN